MYHAKIVGKGFAKACEIGSTGKIHSIFDRAVNIEINQPLNYLLTIVCENVDVLTSNLVVSGVKGTLSDYMKKNNNVILTSDILYVENIPLICGISTAQRWVRLSDNEITKIAHTEIQQTLISACKDVEYYLSKKNKQSILFPNMPIRDFDPLSILGLGIGLTPSGDDFLVGMLHGIHFMEILYDTKFPYLVQIADIIGIHLYKTGTISQHFLKHALNSEWSINTENFLLALVNNNKVALINAIDRKLSVGASSGFDEITGCLYGIKQFFDNIQIKSSVNSKDVY